MSNLFETATQTTPSKAKGSKEYQKVVISDEVRPDFSLHLEKLEEIRTQLANLKADEEMLAGEVKEVAKVEYMRLYKEQGTNPKTFLICGENGGQFMVQVTDRYAKVDEARSADLMQKYGKDIITKSTTFQFNNAILNKEGNMEKITKAIMASELTDAEKNALIQAKTDITVTKGTIDGLTRFENMEEAFMDIEPVIALKNSAR